MLTRMHATYYNIRHKYTFFRDKLLFNVFQVKLHDRKQNRLRVIYTASCVSFHSVSEL